MVEANELALAMPGNEPKGTLALPPVAIALAFANPPCVAAELAVAVASPPFVTPREQFRRSHLQFLSPHRHSSWSRWRSRLHRPQLRGRFLLHCHPQSPLRLHARDRRV